MFTTAPAVQPYVSPRQTLFESCPNEAAITHQHRKTQSTRTVHPPARPVPNLAILKIEIQANIYKVLPSSNSSFLQFQVSLSLAGLADKLK